MKNSYEDLSIEVANTQKNFKELYDSKEKPKYILKRDQWNDWGYKTYFHLMMLSEGGMYYHLADLRMFNSEMRPCDDFCMYECGTHLGFISDEESAFCLKAILDDDELKLLISCLHIRFDIDWCKDEDVFRRSLLRDLYSWGSEEREKEFIMKQKKIKKIIYSPIDYHKLITDRKELFIQMLNNKK